MFFQSTSSSPFIVSRIHATVFSVSVSCSTVSMSAASIRDMSNGAVAEVSSSSYVVKRSRVLIQIRRFRLDLAKPVEIAS